MNTPPPPVLQYKKTQNASLSVSQFQSSQFGITVLVFTVIFLTLSAQNTGSFQGTCSCFGRHSAFYKKNCFKICDISPVTCVKVRGNTGHTYLMPRPQDQVVLSRSSLRKALLQTKSIRSPQGRGNEDLGPLIKIKTENVSTYPIGDPELCWAREAQVPKQP